MIEINSNDYHQLEPFFTGKKQYIPALAVLHGNFPGRVFVNHKDKPSIVIVWAISRWMYLEGKIKSEKNKQELRNFLLTVVVPDCKLRNDNRFEIYTADAAYWDDVFIQDMKFLKADKHYESVYTLNIEKFQKSKNAISLASNELTINVKEYSLLPSKYNGLPYVEQKFKTKTCPGVELSKGSELLTICRNNGFVYMDQYFLDIDTFSAEHRGKGYATTAALLLIDFLLKSRLFPLWETTHQNIASHNLALKLGFEVNESYPVYSFEII